MGNTNTEKRCQGGSCAVVEGGQHRCLHCSKKFKHYREGFRNCGISDTRYFQLVSEQGWSEEGVITDE